MNFDPRWLDRNFMMPKIPSADTRGAPFDTPELPDSVYSNFDHQLDTKVVERLRQGGCHAQHAGWNFCAYVWYTDGKFRSRVYQHYVNVATLEHEDISELIRMVCNEYGDK